MAVGRQQPYHATSSLWLTHQAGALDQVFKATREFILCVTSWITIQPSSYSQCSWVDHVCINTCDEECRSRYWVKEGYFHKLTKYHKDGHWVPSHHNSCKNRKEWQASGAVRYSILVQAVSEALNTQERERERESLLSLFDKNGYLAAVIGEIFGHNRVRSECLQV